MKLSKTMVGYKFFKEVDDSIEMIRLLKVNINSKGEITKVTIRDEATGKIKHNVSSEILKEYKPLQPDGFLTFNIVNIFTEAGKEIKDVVVTGSKFLNLKIGDTMPFVVCRQNITDIFYNLLLNDESKSIVGLSINRDNCPANFDFRIMLSANDIIYTDSIYFYRNDVVKDLFYMINKEKFDKVLEDLYMRHVNHIGDPSLSFKNEHGGWCKSLDVLLKENNFQNDINEMLGIVDVEFEISEHIVEKKLPGKEDETYDSVSDDFKNWLCSIYNININDITILKYDHDIDLVEFKDARYFMMRDNANKLYLLVYTYQGEYHETDLVNVDNKKDFSTKFRLNFYNKYNKDNNK